MLTPWSNCFRRLHKAECKKFQYAHATIARAFWKNNGMKDSAACYSFQGETATVARATISAYFRNSDVRKSRTRVARKGKEIPLVPYREFRMDIRLSHGETWEDRLERVITGARTSRTPLSYLQLEQSSLSVYESTHTSSSIPFLAENW